MTDPLVSKVIIHDSNPNELRIISDFCKDNNLVGLVDKSNKIMDLLSKNIDLGAVFLSEEPDEHGISGIELGMKIHKLRQELPIFLRCKEGRTLDDLPEHARPAFACTYSYKNIDVLKEMVNEYLFSIYYPTDLIKGIQEISESSIRTQIKDMNINCEQPYLVNDRIIYGELSTLIPIESNWCRGYMMLQTEEDETMQLIKHNKTPLKYEEGSFQQENDWLGELTNLIWGAFKNKYCHGLIHDNSLRSQVPIITNHLRKYISFGTEAPQLVFKYTLNDNQNKIKSFDLYQKFVFNLNWSPEDRAEQENTVEEFVQSGDLEFF